jgi:hypothetical protein
MGEFGLTLPTDTLWIGLTRVDDFQYKPRKNKNKRTNKYVKKKLVRIIKRR